MTSGAQFEILADGKTRSFRDARVGDGPPLTIARQPEKIERLPSESMRHELASALPRCGRPPGGALPPSKHFEIPSVRTGHE
jgi:hypothetical protein